MNEFQENILDHYKSPRNYGKPSWKPTFVKDSSNISCGDSIKLYVKLTDDLIEGIAFEGEGCSISIASASILSEEFKNVNRDSTLALSDDDYLKRYIGIDLTASRRKCALLSLNALRSAIS